MYLHQILHVVFFGAVTLHCRALLMLVSCEILYNYEESPQLKWLNESRIIPAIHGLSHAEVKPSKRRELQDFRFFPVFFSRIAGNVSPANLAVQKVVFPILSACRRIRIRRKQFNEFPRISLAIKLTFPRGTK
jgi:hypothetical protein